VLLDSHKVRVPRGEQGRPFGFMLAGHAEGRISDPERAEITRAEPRATAAMGGPAGQPGSRSEIGRQAGGAVRGTRPVRRI